MGSLVLENIAYLGRFTSRFQLESVIACNPLTSYLQLLMVVKNAVLYTTFKVGSLMFLTSHLGTMSLPCSSIICIHIQYNMEAVYKQITSSSIYTLMVISQRNKNENWLFLSVETLRNKDGFTVSFCLLMNHKYFQVIIDLEQ